MKTKKIGYKIKNVEKDTKLNYQGEKSTYNIIQNQFTPEVHISKHQESRTRSILSPKISIYDHQWNDEQDKSSALYVFTWIIH